MNNNPYFIVERAGMDTETSYNKYPEFQAWEEGKLAGMKEVVEDLLKTKQMPDKPSSEPYPGLVLISKVQFEAKLKEWGLLEEGNDELR